MANSPQAKKRARQAVKRRTRNVAKRSEFRTVLKSIVYAIDAGDKESAVSAFTAAKPVIDSMVSKGLIHKNNAARHKSRLNARIKALG
ncbi:MAG: 30S ribosomal protein S20 [gamma proteobacterium symbiont of Bathyaustriella thionipta]|nr:30S ribosomal protein S20 [gamma proteobacterium symbiont of Bathyaustriella thionipta]MCU7949579.1 30S ribosomal protein S20 [gamma proteobacterium symbiont of Bathyaustriella thionipta]MCU7952821.1 30S ribosomal protein S20 [gamma proteobacterium symbiont of Bathyaustriella thionipta]MCU7956171.1 30S ribosomal protein S20 [gamma proteobacterium symbiont of Bathyaustriella thionipta]MCU7967588.1 30S ribosomal protein S20 [gamma proteobacterium symbiont of Bathyaustriella thionipta]